MFGADVSPDVSTLGPGEPALAAVGGVHGDEPSGVRAIRAVLESNPDLERAVKFVVANPQAAVAHRRYLDADLNRVFPGDPAADARERRLAARLCAEVEGCTVLSMHSTHSCPDPIAFVSGDRPRAQEVASRLPLDYVVNEEPGVEGAFTSSASVVSVEVGRQLTEAATENARDVVRAFLQLTDALPGDPPETSSAAYYSLVEPIEKPDGDAERHELLVENFEPVEAGTTYAHSGDESFVADEDFVPILLSETGYDDIFGYRGRAVGDSLEEARDAWLDGAVADAD